MGLFGSKPMASLSSGLLARKGEARPAMRPQGMMTFGGNGPSPASLEDLGWNDMGDAGGTPPPAAPLPPVLRAREALESLVAAEPVEQAEPVAPAAPPEAAAPVAAPAASVAAPVLPDLQPIAAGKKAAFTLRLDPQRHLRLRVASVVRGCSSQWLVTQALDALLDTIPELSQLADRPKDEA